MTAVRNAAAAVLEAGTDVTTAAVQRAMAGDAGDVSRCIENWTEIGQWVQGDGRLAALPDAIPDNGRNIVLLSLFDGTGMAR
eukprot:3069908-Lingulodinium_polyedra.AAC.1